MRMFQIQLRCTSGCVSGTHTTRQGQFHKVRIQVSRTEEAIHNFILSTALSFRPQNSPKRRCL